ncbi:uncharacterized protein PHA67_018535 [Liasis olivaceus]
MHLLWVPGEGWGEKRRAAGRAGFLGRGAHGGRADDAAQRSYSPRRTARRRGGGGAPGTRRVVGAGPGRAASPPMGLPPLLSSSPSLARSLALSPFLPPSPSLSLPSSLPSIVRSRRQRRRFAFLSLARRGITRLHCALRLGRGSPASREGAARVGGEGGGRKGTPEICRRLLGSGTGGKTRNIRATEVGTPLRRVFARAARGVIGKTMPENSRLPFAPFARWRENGRKMGGTTLAQVIVCALVGARGGTQPVLGWYLIQEEKK